MLPCLSVIHISAFWPSAGGNLPERFRKTRRLKYDGNVLRETQIDSLANFLVDGLIARGIIKPIRDQKEIVACVVELMSSNFETEARIDEEANRMAEEEVRKDPRADFSRLRTLIKQRLAERKGFVL